MHVLHGGLSLGMGSVCMSSAWAVIERQGRVLLTRRSTRTSRPGQWCLPGGGIHAGETAAAACVREVREEVGLQAQVIRPLLVEDDQHFFLCEAVEGPIQLKANEVQEYAWVAPSRLREQGVIMDFRRLQRVLRAVRPPPPLVDEPS